MSASTLKTVATAITRLVAVLLEAGVAVYSAPTMRLALGIDDNAWRVLDRTMTRAAYGLIGLKDVTWTAGDRNSARGDAFSRAGRPVVWMAAGVLLDKFAPHPTPTEADRSRACDGVSARRQTVSAQS